MTSNDGSTTRMIEKVKALVEIAKDACHRPLFMEISDCVGGISEQAQHYLLKKRENSNERRTWNEVLADASDLFPYMTSNDHGLFSKCAAIYLLAYFNPYSTGFDYLASSSMTSNPRDEFWDMDIEQRLENSSRYFQANSLGQFYVCSDGNRERAFRTFLEEGLAPFMSGRPAHIHQTDVLHLIAMAISPHVTTEAIDFVVAPLEESQTPSWIKTRRLMRSLHPPSFVLSYGHRILMVKLLANSILIPCTEGPQEIAGFVPHLLASLHTFAAHMAISVADSHLAHQGMLRIATQTGQEWIVREVFYLILAQTIEDRNQCHCPSFCIHAARGKLLRDCIVTFNVARHYADPTFTTQAFVALHGSIEEQIEPWLNGSTIQPQVGCLLSSLLLAAESLFYFLLEQDPDVHKAALLELIVPLLHHPHSSVRQNASSLLSTAFSFISSCEKMQLLPCVSQSLKLAWSQQFVSQKSVPSELGINHIATISAQLSNGFAFSMLTYLFEMREKDYMELGEDNDDQRAESTARIISRISCANPIAGFQQTNSIVKLLEKESNMVARGHLVAALLASRQAFAFGKDIKATTVAVHNYLRDIQQHKWKQFLLARHAFITGNFAVSSSIYRNILPHTISKDSYLFVSALLKIADGECNLLENGAKGIPLASKLIQTAIPFLETLERERECSMEFQIQFLRLRLDFLDLSAATRLFCKEIRLGGTVPKDNNRVGLHLLNSLKLWKALASRFHRLYRRYGILLCFHSRAAIRSGFAICQQIAEAAPVILSEIIGNKFKTEKEQSGPKGNQMHPTIRLLKRINGTVLPTLDKSVEPSVRATLLTELLEGIHKSPFPFPKCFMSSRPIPKANIRISLDPSQPVKALNQEDLLVDGNLIDSAHIYPGTQLSIVASGSVPKDMFDRNPYTPSQLLLWSYVCALSSNQEDTIVDEYENAQIEIPENYKSSGDNRRMPTVLGPFEVQQLSTSLKFVTFVELPEMYCTGLFRLDFRLGYRDVGCGEWDLPQNNHGSSLLIRISKSAEPLL